MSSGSRQRLERVQAWFGADTEWERAPTDPVRTRRTDVLIASVLLVTGLLGIETLRSLDSLSKLPGPLWLPHLAVVVGTVPLVWRRRYPIMVMAGLSLHFLVVGLTLPAVASSFSMQVVYFFAIFTGVAWARNRQAMLMVAGGVVMVMFGWLAWQFAVGSGLENILSSNGRPPPRQGLFSPLVAYAIYFVMINVFYFGGAVIGGQAAWRAALQREHLTEQAVTIEAQAVDLQRQAVIEERLRIARELHDVVAHHVSVIGIQAAAARRVMGRDIGTAERSLRSIESSSRDAVTQMRGLLGTLRSTEATEGDPRAPEPGLADVPGLVDSARSTGLRAEFSVVEDRPGAVASVPSPISLSLYRTAQEALANVRRHSTATSASVFVRVDRRGESGFDHGYAEVEVIDTGRPRVGTSGTGLGLLGVRERLSMHGGTSEIGPRATGGYRVRVRMPLPEESA